MFPPVIRSLVFLCIICSPWYNNEQLNLKVFFFMTVLTTYWPICAYIHCTGPQDNQMWRFTFRDSRKVLIVIIIRITSTQCEVTPEKSILWHLNVFIPYFNILNSSLNHVTSSMITVLFLTPGSRPHGILVETPCVAFLIYASSEETPIAKRITKINSDIMFFLCDFIFLSETLTIWLYKFYKIRLTLYSPFVSWCFLSK